MKWLKHRKPVIHSTTSTALPRTALMMPLEQRLMFDGALVVTAADAVHATMDAHTVTADKPTALSNYEPAAIAKPLLEAAPSSTVASHAVVFVDARVQDASQLLQNVAAGTEVVYLQQGQDGLQQMSDYLAAHPGASSIQIIAEGSEGNLWLGNTFLTADNIASHSSELAKIGTEFNSGGDILIYACNTAAGNDGLSFVDSIANFTGHNVAASNDRTGIGSNWNLEVTTGSIEATPVLAAASEAAYQYDLSTITVTSNADSGAGTLRNDIASATAGDTITFSSAMTITLSSGELLINKNLTIEGDLDSNGTPDVTINANYTSRVIEVTSGKTVALDGLIIENGFLTGAGGDRAAGTGGAGGDALGAAINNAGTLTITHSTITHSVAAGGGGAGGDTYSLGSSAGAGGGGGGFGSTFGGASGNNFGGGIQAGPSAGTGGRGDGFNAGSSYLGGGGGSGGTGVGAAGVGSNYGGYSAGSAGGLANNGTIRIGGGGGGAGYDAAGGRGGNAVGGIYNTGTLTITGSTITNNIGAGGGGGGGSIGGHGSGNGGAGGTGVGGIWSTGTLFMDTSSSSSLSTGNAGAGAVGGSASGGGGSTGATGTTQNASLGTITPYVAPATITSATYDASTGSLVVTGASMTTGDTIDVSKLSLTGQGGSYTLTSANVTAASATSFTVTLNATDQININGILNKNGTAAVDITTFNLAGAANWDSTASSSADLTGNGITVSNVTAPTITSATYNASTDVLVVTGTGLVKTIGATNDITVNKLTITGEGGATYTLSTSSNVEITSATSFSITLSGADIAGVNTLLNKNGTSSIGTTTYNLAGADDWDSVVTGGNIADLTGNGITVSNASPIVVSSTYDASTGTLVVTGANMITGDTIDVSKLSLTGQAGSYTLTSANVTAASATSFTVTLNAADQININGILNNNGTSAVDTTTFNLAAASSWDASRTTSADLTSNAVTVSNVTAPTITSATYDGSTHIVTVTGTGLVKTVGATNDITVDKLTFTGESGATYSLSTTSNVEITSATSFSVTLSGADIAGVNALLNKNGTSSLSSSTTYNLAAGDDWDSVVTGGNIADLTGNGITVSNAAPAIASAAYDASTGNLVVTGANMVTGDTIDVSKLSLTGQGGSYTLTSANVTAASATSFTVTLNAADITNVNGILNNNGTSAVDTTTFNVAGAASWDASRTTSADLTGNAVTVSNVTAPTITSSTYNFSTNVLTVTGTGLVKTIGATNDIAVNKLTFTGEGGSTYTLSTSSNVEITSATSFSVTLSGADIAGVNALLNKNGISSTDATTYNLAAADDWDSVVTGGNIADLTGNGVTVGHIGPQVSSVAVPTNATYIAGQNLDFTVNFDSVVTVNTGGGTPFVNLTLNTGGTVQAAYLSGSGTAALTFRYTVVSGNFDPDGIALASSISANGGTLQNNTSDNATLTLNSVASTVSVLVDGVAPSVSSITRVSSALTNATSEDYTVTFSENVSGVDASDFTLTTTGTASGSIASVTPISSSSYTVTVNTLTGDGTVRLDLNNSGTGITDIPGNAIGSGFTSGQAYTLDHTAPTVNSVSVPANATYIAGQNLDFTVNLSESVTVDNTGGTPRIAITLDTGGTVYASYLSGSGTNALVFRYTIATGNADSNGITVGALGTNGGTLRDAAGNDATLTLNSVGSTTAVLVDAIAPTVNSVSVPSNGTYAAGQNLDFAVNFSENVTVNTGGGTPYIAVTLDTGGTVHAAYVSGSGTSALTFRYTVAPGTVDNNGISVGALSANGGTLRDSTGNDAVTTLNSVGSTTSVLVDGVAPNVSSITRVSSALTNATSVDYTVMFSENVSGVDASDFTLTSTGTAAGSIASVSAVNGSTYTVTVNTLSGDGTVRLDLDNSGTGITDTPGNAITTGFTSGQTYTLDHTAPGVNSVSVPASATYIAGQNLDFTVNTSEAVTVDTSGGTPRIAITLDAGGTVYASYLSGSGTNALVFRYTIATGNADSNGITVDALGTNGGTLRDAAGNDATLTLNSVGSTTGVLVDAIAPTVNSVSVPSNGTYAAGQNLDFTVNTSEAVTVDTSGGTPRIAVTLDTGGTIYASYLSGSGTNALTFRAMVATGEMDSNGITLGSSIDVNGGTLHDAVGNNAVLTLNSVGSTVNVLVDAIAPTVASVNVPASSDYHAGEVLTFTVNTSENVTVDTSGGMPRIALDVGGNTVYASYTSGNGSNALVFQYTVQTGDNDADGIAVSALQTNGGILHDTAGNTLNTTLNNVAATSGVIVDTTAPTANSIVRVNGNPTNAPNVSYSVSFSEDVSGVDTSDFALTLGGTANGSIASVTQVDARTYTVNVNSLVGTGTVELDLNASGTGITDAAGNAITGGLAGAVYSIDRDAPAVINVAVPTDGTYVAGQTLDFTVNLSEAVIVDTTGGIPRIAITLDTGGTIYASYLAGSGTSALTFRTTVMNGELDTNGISMGPSIDVNGGSIHDAVGNNTLAALNSVAATTGILVDAVDPTIASVSVPAVGHYNAGNILNFTVNTSAPVIVDTTGGTPQLILIIDGVTRNANYVSGSGSNALVFQYTVQAGDNSDGVAMSNNLNSNGATLHDAAGNALNIGLNNIAVSTGVVLDNTAPIASSLVRADASPTSANSVHYTLSFSEDVTGLTANDLSLITTSNVDAQISSITQVDGHTYTVTLTDVKGNGSLQVNLTSANGITDLAGNALVAGITGNTYQILTTTPNILVNHAYVPLPAPDYSAHEIPGTFTTQSLFAATMPLTETGNITDLSSLPVTHNIDANEHQPLDIALPWRPINLSSGWSMIELRNVDGSAVPTWLHYDVITGTLQGTPPANFHGVLQIEIVMTDTHGAHVLGTVELHFNVTHASDTNHLASLLPKHGTAKASLDTQFAHHQARKTIHALNDPRTASIKSASSSVSSALSASLLSRV